MKKIILITMFLSTISLSQHLPLKISNQWHYDPAGVPGGTQYAAIVVDTTIINNKTYFKIERREAFTGELLETTFDRLEGDSVYYRIKNNVEKKIINFNWPEGFARTTTTDSICYYIDLIWNIAPGTFWGFTTDFYQFRHGVWCVGQTDTAWTLFMSEVTRLFGCRWAGDGRLEGAIIDGTIYGVLYPLPVELISFNYDVHNNDVQLSWTTVSETNNQGFEILRATQEDNWNKVGFVEGHGTTTETHHYSFTDIDVESGKYQYKLKQIDYDGSFEYSDIIELEIPSVNKFSLSQNYPNPFNPSTTIQYEIPERGIVILRVYDVLGNEVATLINEEKTVGSYEVEFIGTGLTSGIYFYQLRVGYSEKSLGQGFVETKKMLLLK